MDEGKKVNYDGFDELKIYIMETLSELKLKIDKLDDKLNEWRQQTLAETVAIKTKISVFAGIIAFIVSLGVTLLGILFTK